MPWLYLSVEKVKTHYTEINDFSIVIGCYH